MKLITHVMFNMGLLAYLLVRLSTPMTWLYMLISVGVVTQFYIDLLGHTRNHGFTHRSWVTHDAVLSLATVVAPFTALTMLLGVNYLLGVFTGLVSLYSHLFLDYMTGNVFVLARRVHGYYIEYDNPVANALFIVIGLVLIFLAR